MKEDHFGNTEKKAGFPKQKIKVREPASEAENPEEMKEDHFGNPRRKAEIPEEICISPLQMVPSC